MVRTYYITCDETKFGIRFTVRTPADLSRSNEEIAYTLQSRVPKAAIARMLKSSIKMIIDERVDGERRWKLL